MNKIRNKKTVLITAMGGDIGFGYAKAIYGEEFLLTGCDMNPLPMKNSLLRNFFQVPSAKNPKEYFAAIKDVIAKEKIDLIIPISEPEIECFHVNREHWSSWEAKVLINNECILNNFLDKYKTAEYLREIGINTPKTYLLRDYDNQLDFPMIVKKRKGCGSKNIWKVESQIDIDYLKQKDDGAYLVQEYIGRVDQEYTTGIFSDGNNVSSITFKRKLGMGGLSIEVELVDSSLMDNIAIKIAHETNLIGSINVQTRFHKGEFIPFEINPRFSSTVGFRKQFGFLDCLWWPRLCFGETYNYKKQYKSGRGIRYLTESCESLERI